MIWTFGAFELDDRARTLRRAGQVVALRRKVFDVLCHLIARSGELVTKEELLSRLWPNETIIPAVIPQNITVLRRALGDTRGSGNVIQTVHGKGYRFVAAVQRRDARASLPLSAAFVGRERALGDLRAKLRSALAGYGQVAVVHGEAGVGKTRLLQELLHEARPYARVAVAHCQDTEGALPLRPWRDLLRQLTASGALSASSEVASRLLGQPRHLAASEARFCLFDAVTNLLVEACRDRPLVLVLDDVHDADELSLMLFAFVARELSTLPLLLAATRLTTRPASSATATATATPDLSTSPLVKLAGLDADATSELLALALGRVLSAEALQQVLLVTEGNPCLLLELVRTLRDTTADDQALETCLREVLQLRLRRLGANVARVLELAAVIGREFRLPVLEALAGVSRAELLDALAVAREARVLTDLTTFAHASIQERVYEAVPAVARARLHHRIGVLLEDVLGDDVHAHLPELAWHFQRAAISGDAARAVTYCKLAAERAFEERAFERAALHYRAALAAQLLQLPIDEQLRFQLRLGLGASQRRAGEELPALKQ